MTYTGIERRKYPRLNCHFLVSYGVCGENCTLDVSQLKNISLGGVCFTAGEQFEKEATLALKIRLPFFPDPIMATGRVIESRESVQGLIYDTRLEFSSMDEYDTKILSKTLYNYLNAKN